MSSCSQAPNCPNFCIGNWLFDIPAPPLPCLPGHLGDSPASCPESSLADCSAGYPVESPASCSDGDSVGYSAGCLESCWASCPTGSGEESSPRCSAERPAKRPASGPESSLPGSPENSLPDSPESGPASRPAECLGDSRCRAVNRPTACVPLLQLDDIGAEAMYARTVPAAMQTAASAANKPGLDSHLSAS
jgi:hypothetical protein